jgi:DNA polymerase-3 subunit alpha
MLSLINRSHYSLGFGSLRHEEIIKHALTQPEKTAALTDTNTLSGIPEFLRDCEKSGVKGIAGVTLRVGHENKFIGDIVVLANDAEGFEALNDILSGLVQDERMSQCGLTDIGKLGILPSGKVSVLDGFPGSVLSRNGAGASSQIQRATGDDYIVTLTPSSMMGKIDIAEEVEKLSQNSKVNMIETSTAVFNPTLNMSMVALHRYRTQLERVKEVDELAVEAITEMTYLPEEKVSLWREYNLPTIDLVEKYGLTPTSKFTELPDAGILSSTNKIEPLTSDLIGEFKVEVKALLAEYLVEKSIAPELHSIYNDRLDVEFDTFRETDGAEVYIQNTKALLDLSKEENISARLRGSASGSLALSLFVPKGRGMDPIEFGQLVGDKLTSDVAEYGFSFSRFMDKNRNEMPDVDIDISDVKAFTRALQAKFGDDNVVSLKTFGTVKSPKKLMKEAAKALAGSVGVKTAEHYEDTIKKFEKLFKPFEKRVPKYMSFDEFLAEPQIKKAYKEDEILYQMISVARRFQGLYISSGAHNGGVLFSRDRPCSKSMAAVKLPEKLLVRSELTADSAKLVGQIKYDALLASEAGSELEIAREQLMLMHNVELKEDLRDPALYKAIQLDALDGIYQLSGLSTRPVINQVQPKSFYDVIACLTLAKAPKKGRGGSESDLEQYLRNKNQGLSLPSDKLIPHLEKTHGVILFDEQITDICMDIADFTFTEGDTLRSAFKKKKFDVVDELKVKFIAGAMNKGMPKQEAEAVFAEIDRKKDSYTMPKAHAASYVKVALEQMHLKLNYPDTFINVYGKTIGVNQIRQEYVQKLGYQIRPLDVLRTPVDGGLRIHQGVRYIVDGLNSRFSDDMVNAIVKSRTHESFMNQETPNVVRMVHVLSENYMGRPLPDPSIQNDNETLKSLVSDMIKLVEQGGFNAILGENQESKMEELKQATPELVNMIVSGRNAPVVQNDNVNMKISR